MSFESRLRQEAREWVTDGLVTAEQAQRLLDRHPVPESSAARRFLTIVCVLGAVLCAIGVALIVGANWQDIHRWAKLGVLLLLLGGAYGAGWHAKFVSGDSPRLGDALLLAGCLLFLLGIALVSQIYHLDGRPGDAVLVWSVGIAVVPFLARSPAAFGILLTAVYAWFTIEATAADGRLNFVTGGHRAESVGLPFVLICGSLALYWGSFLWRGAAERLATLQKSMPVVVVCLMVYASGFAHKRWWGQEARIETQPAFVMLAVVGALGVLAARARWQEWRQLSPWLVLAAGPALVAVAGGFGPEVRTAASVLSWATLIVLNVFMARTGLELGQPWLVNAAVAFIALNLFTRYFDIFGSMLDQGLLFLVSGLVVLGLGWYLERKRRSLLRRIQPGGGPS